MITLDDLRGRATITVPEAGQLLSIGRDAAYRAAERGEIPVLHLGRRLVCPVPKLLDLLGVTSEHTEAGPSPDPAAAQPSAPLAQEPRHVQCQPEQGQTANVRPLRR